MYRQYELGYNGHRLTCWLEYHPQVKKGSIISLKHAKTSLWKVLTVGTIELKHPPAIDWKVGGLS